MPRNGKIDNRKIDEKQEGYDTVKTGLPSDRYSDSKQVLTPEELGVDVNTPKDSASVVGTSSAKAAKITKSKMKISPDVSFEQLEGKQVGGVPLAAGQATRSVAGVSSQSPADDRSKIPYSPGNYRPETRYGKKRSEELFEMDNTISEQVVPIVDDLPDLRENPDEPIGYNGRKQFKQTRSKKNFSFTTNENHDLPKSPQQLLNDASVDFVTTNKVVYTSGQMITDEIEAQGNYPTITGNGVAIPDNNQMHKSNYLLERFNFTIADGHITDVSFQETCYDVDATPLVRDQANMNHQVDTNNITKTMIKIQKELGRETTDKWTPLAYVVHQPYEYNTLLHDIESTTGAIAATSYRSAVSSMAYQKNIISKDGINPQRNAIKMIMEGYLGEFSTDNLASMTDLDFQHVIFNEGEYKQGSVAALIDMFDTTRKYTTKADLLGLQRSLGMHLAQADNNINPLHCKENFIKALDKAHMFSTVSGNYNPFLPIFETGTIKLINPLSLNYFLTGWKNPALFTADDRANIRRDQDTGTYSIYTYEYSDIRNRYTTRVQHPLIEGILRWMLKHEGAIVRVFGAGDVSMPASFNFKSPSLFEFIVCSALQDIVYERNIIFRDVLFAGEQMNYIWDDLKGLDTLNPLYSSQLTIGKYNEPLKLGKLAPDTAIRELWGNHLQLTDYQAASLVPAKDGKVQYLLPWYFSERSFGTASGSYTANEGFLNEPTAFNMSFPSIRDGIRHEYIDLIKGMSVNDVRLSLDRWLDIPQFVTIENQLITIDNIATNRLLWKHVYHNNTSAVLNNYIKLSTLRYDANSDGRLVATYDLTSGSNRNLGYDALYLIPKEIGFIDDLYCPMYVMHSYTYARDTVTPVGTNIGVNLDVGITTANAYSGFTPLRVTSYRVNADSNADQAIDRSAALSQIFYRMYADPSAATENALFIEETGIIPTLSYLDGANDQLYGIFNLDSNHESTTSLDNVILSNSRRIWSIIQRFFMPIDRFANCFNITNTTHSFDPMEAAIYFGFCGMLAADYTQCVLERLDVYDQLGIDYTEDINVKDSLIFR